MKLDIPDSIKQILNEAPDNDLVKQALVELAKDGALDREGKMKEKKEKEDE